MCGIVGLIDTDGGGALDLVPIMRDTMLHRGPNGAGNYRGEKVSMSMRRLSIIDLEGGSQPLTSLHGQVLAFQNGEIYNYRDLKKQLEAKGYVFRTASDTEVLAHGYAQWGMEGLLQRIDGMFSIAILDKRSNELHLARDRFGEKPLFYTTSPGKFAYSSYLLPLAALPWADVSINIKALDWYLAVHYVPGDITIFNGIKRVLPGQRLVVSLANPEPVPCTYYRPALGGAGGRKKEHDLLSILEESTKARLVADVPVGVFLSGGLDSSLIAAIAAKHSPGIATFSMGFDDQRCDESHFAKLVAHHVGSSHHHFRFDQDSFETLLPKVVDALDEPLGDQAMLPLYWLSREARNYVTVVLSGEGADEVFGGYDYYRPFCKQRGWREKLFSRFRTAKAPWPITARFAHNTDPVTPSGFPLLADPAMRFFLTGVDCFDGNLWESQFMTWINCANTALQRASAADLLSWLPDDLLVKFDRMTMANSIEGRAPYLHKDVVALGLNLPDHCRMRDGLSKIALRTSARRYLPKEILTRKKQGFVLPMKKWLIKWFQSRGGAKSYFAPREFPGLNMEQLGILVEKELKEGAMSERFLFSVVSLLEWYQSFMVKVESVKKAMKK